jgi:hypothetical protein
MPRRLSYVRHDWLADLIWSKITRMRTITRGQANQWCETHEIALTDSAHEFKIPKDAGERVYLVAKSMASFETSREVLIWFDDWSVWPSSQRMHLFDRLRLSYGESRSLSAVPAQIFDQSEFEDVVSFVTLGVLFLFDCYVICSDGKEILFFSHDEWGWATNE